MDATWTLRIGREVQAGTAVITLTGRIGSEASGQLMDALIQTIDEGHRRILVDLEGVDYVSSAGLLALDAAAGRLYGVGGALVLCAVCEPVRVVLDMAGVLTDLPVEPSKRLDWRGSAGNRLTDRVSMPRLNRWPKLRSRGESRIAL